MQKDALACGGEGGECGVVCLLGVWTGGTCVQKLASMNAYTLASVCVWTFCVFFVGVLGCPCEACGHKDACLHTPNNV